MAQEVAKVEADAPAAGLSERQAAFVDAMLEGHDPEEARQIAGYPVNIPTVRILRGKLVQIAISKAVDGRMIGELKLKAMKTLENLLDSKSHQAALGAARAILQHAQEADKEDDKPLAEMTPAELAALIERLEGEKAGRARDVTPGNGA